jgi:hypothetical protein
VQSHLARLRLLSLTAASTAIGLFVLAGCKQSPSEGGGKDKDPFALSVPAKAESPARSAADAERERSSAVRPGAASARGDDEPSIDDEPAPAAAPNGGRRVASSAPAARRRRAQSARSGHAAEPSSADEPTLDDPIAPADLKVTRLVVARGVNGREPVGAATSFSAESVEKIYAFVDLQNDAKVESEVFVTFTPNGGGPGHRIKLDVGAEKRWRTWALSRKPRTPGSWTATVRDGGGKVLARTTFEVTP